ncbi:MAG TPA: rod shape-determining protein MreC [Candidatus Marinimicrobia bacterium]|nr:rod shape-determining protein MreC [Candidatus Neomarinimicrobiota bacterium]HBN45707.1 rod shape-determining protein MreC [Candidatus Neomarinimicrobiota bacterium]HJL74618.1 rod shape-determining protein MreC [Candidatus Neomarinimicrobiota bacterium]HJM70533.1 rod shape-determining protein MreC [Candidatus Neomarinimicrobiota bacterium]|tara:strand:+ start:2324 stop:3124 length:801 start_codon:yes stop_codon:yes gene_type:complete
MRKFYLALIRQRDHVVFFLAVLISFTLILTNDSRDIAILRGKANDAFAFMYQPVSWLRSMVIVEEEAAMLREKNIQLKLQVESMLNLANENEQLKNLLNYKRESQLRLLPAKVINKGITSNMSTITIDVGSEHGVKRNAPILTPNGVIGKTVAVGKYSSTVQVISDVNFRLSVQIKPSNARGILRWVYGDLCEIREVQKNSEINIGDRVLTSGFSDIFPKDLPVGEVTGIREERGSFQKIVTIRFAENLGSLINIFVITTIRNAVE